MCRASAAHRSAYGLGSPLLYRAQHLEPWTRRHQGGSPVSQDGIERERARGAATLDRLDDHRPRLERGSQTGAATLFDGISRSWYATAPSTKISVFSPGLRAQRPISALLQSITADVRDEELVVRVELRTHVVRASWRAVRR